MMQTRQISLIFSNIHYGTSNLSFQASDQDQKTNNSFFHNIINPFEFSDYSSVEEDEIDPDLFYNKLDLILMKILIIWQKEITISIF